jgi:hypothetical protein
MQILPIPHLHDLCPSCDPCPSPIHLEFTHIHLISWLRWSRSRSHPPSPTNLQESQGKILQRLQTLCHRQLARRRHHENELFLLELRAHTVAISAVRHLSSVLRLLFGVSVLFVWGESGAVTRYTNRNRHDGETWRILTREKSEYTFHSPKQAPFKLKGSRPCLPSIISDYNLATL